MKLHAALSRIFKRSYTGKLFLVAFLGTHVPLLALILWMLLRRGPHDPALTHAALVALLATLAGTVLTLYLLHRLLLPVRAAAAALDDYEREQRLPDLPEHGDDEASRLMRGVNRNLRRIDEGVRELQHFALNDPLTGALNRRGCEQAMADSVRRARQTRAAFCLAVADMDNLKPINDRHGHAAGDQVLIGLVLAAREMLRPGEWIGRWGGDEFLIGLNDDAASARLRLSRWLQGLSAAERPLHASIGLSMLQPGQSVHALYRVADAAMYRAKHAGGQRIVDADE